MSDVDLLVTKDQIVIAIEVKSSHDNLDRARLQLSKLSNYVDYVFLATDYEVDDWNEPAIGLLLVRRDRVLLARKGVKLSSRPSFQSLFALQHKCLSRMLGAERPTYLNKYDTAKRVDLLGDDDILRECVKEIVTCGGQCSSNCPIWNFTDCAVDFESR